MPLYELRDWMAVVKAYNLMERIDLQYDLAGYTRSVTKESSNTLKQDRDKMISKINRLMMIGEDQKSQDETWAMIKKSGTSFRLLNGGKNVL